ncbi:MAG: HmuY family protein [Fluviicola sp.]
MIRRILCTLLIVPGLFLISCLKEEIPIDQPDPGDVVQNSYKMGTDYRMNSYYDIQTNSFVKEHLKTDWDLGFETGTNGWRIVLNTSKAMAAGEAPNADFIAVVDTIGVEWRNDAPSWNLDSTAIGDWQQFGGTYCIDRGFSFDGTHQGYRKMAILSVDDYHYEIRFANMDGSDEVTVEIPKSDDNFNFAFFSFETNNLVDIEPEKETWDLVFRQYTHIFDGHTPYLVTGVLSNTNNVEVAEVFSKPFEQVTFDDIATSNFRADIDVIGYDWKTFNGSGFETHSEQVYIVKTTEGLYYKLRFVDFYNSQGDKGTPTFEVQAL